MWFTKLHSTILTTNQKSFNHLTAHGIRSPVVLMHKRMKHTGSVITIEN